MMWNVVVLGGGHDALAQAHGVATKALIPICGRPIAAYVLDALRGSGKVGKLVYVGATSPELKGIDHEIPDAGSLVANLAAGTKALGNLSGRILVVTADIPLITAQEIEILLSELEKQPENTELIYPIVSRSSCEKAYPTVKRTYAKVREGAFTGGNIFIVSGNVIERFLPTIEKVFEYRKSPLKLAQTIGIGTAFKFIAGQLSIGELEKKVSRILDVKANALITQFASIGTDIDKEDDLLLANQILSKR